MFRSLLPRATPRAALRSAGPKAVPSNFIATPSLTLFTKRGYASESGRSSNSPDDAGQGEACRGRCLLFRIKTLFPVCSRLTGGFMG
ncbi:uncharacterized protein BO95DRAFT_446313 [Aspergillus brunneoviolaceus CBS 621.78]|uniref:Uncharacterized protein n=1 Tax=Aspergillus brunneoviolaceus CBS 621.78 TaxID=1450534 RepID=A0ACD1FYH7_9EURO|nr:hypothetical protein BO95DRAFT_446313 [Aspergillus brunneoviolaceus CBS 621.78]RAH42023.1 hypothetical protein BO95DRAFT_446313 [Aspergillus brunneoviolaceus CBS 621.78]